MTKRLNTKRTVLIALLAAFATAVHALEGLLPPMFPGLPLKIGFANLFTLYALISLHPLDALMILLVRCTLGSMLSGSVTGFIYSVVGSIFSFFTMLPLLRLYKKGKLGTIGISVVGAWFSNVGQLIVGTVFNGPAVFTYFPYLEIIGILSGALIGILTHLLVNSANIRRLQDSILK